VLDEFGVPTVNLGAVRSLLVMPVASEGKKIGILVVGSAVGHAFTAYHYDALAIHTRTLAESYKVLVRKLNTVLAAQAGFKYEDALKRLSESRLLKFWLDAKGFEFMLYAVDHEKGELIPKVKPDVPNGPWHRLKGTEDYLATVALNRGVTLHFKNRAEALEYVRHNPNVLKGLDHYDVTGNLYITPIRSTGYISTILVCWINSEQSEKRYTAFERAKRIVRVLFNNFKDSGAGSPADRFLNDLDRSMSDEDDRRDSAWKKARQKPGEHTDRLVRSVLRPLVTSTTGLTRVRLWVRTAPAGLDALDPVWARLSARRPAEPVSAADRVEFQIMYSLADQTAVDPAHQDDDYYKITPPSEATDEYTYNTLDRYATDPYAREIDPRSDPAREPDKNAPVLHKDPTGSWLTAPLVYREKDGERRLRLIGFLSADDHRFVADRRAPDDHDHGYVKPGKGTDAGTRLAFQRCVLDLASHIIAPLITARFFTTPRIGGGSGRGV